MLHYPVIHGSLNLQTQVQTRCCVEMQCDSAGLHTVNVYPSMSRHVIMYFYVHMQCVWPRDSTLILVRRLF
jgi:hypothetical protein